MEIYNSVINSISTLYLFLGIALIIYKSKVQLQNILLGFFMLCISISSLSEDYGYIIEDIFLFSPLFLNLYINRLYQIKTNKFYFLLFIPGIIFYDWSLVIIQNGYFNFKPLIVLLSYFSSIIILLNSINKNITYVSMLKTNYSEISSSYKWINTVIILSSMWCLYPFLFIINDMIPFIDSELYFETLINFQYLILILLFFQIIFIGFSSSSFSESIITINLIEKNEKEINIKKVNNNEKQELFYQLKKDIKESKLYLDPKLSLFTLSKKINKSPQSISDLINNCSDDNFYSLINKMRIEDFKIMVVEKKHLKYNIESIASMCGFNSKSTFYRAFKEFEGISPSQFIKNKS